MNDQQYSGANSQFNMSYQSVADGRGDILCANASGEDIPPFAAMMLNGSLTGKARQVVKPDADNLDASLIIFNGSMTIPSGYAEFFASSNYESLAMVSTVPAINDDLGTAENQWYLVVDNTGFRARGAIGGGLAYASPFRGLIGSLSTLEGVPGVSGTGVTGEVSGSWIEITTPIKYIPGSYWIMGEWKLWLEPNSTTRMDIYLDIAYDNNTSQFYEAPLAAIRDESFFNGFLYNYSISAGDTYSTVKPSPSFEAENATHVRLRYNFTSGYVSFFTSTLSTNIRQILLPF